MVRINATIYCSGAPNYFIFAVSNAYASKGDTFSLICNQSWIHSSNNLTEEQLSNFIELGTDTIYVG